MRPVALIAAALVVASCQILNSLAGRIDDPLELSISNSTTLVVTLVVNDQVIGSYGPGAHNDPIHAVLLPAPPWHVEAQTASGRVLVSMDVRPGDVWHTTEDPDGHSSSQSAGARADLTCGRLDIWSGAPMLGPIRTSFPPGDCDP
ncbi:MAG: hypothetical protein WD830_02335 [Chloroflexota bacterium]